MGLDQSDIYQTEQIVMLMAGFALGGYTVSLIGVVVQLKLYDRFIGKLRLTLFKE